MGQFSMVIYTPPGSLLSGNQHSVAIAPLALHIWQGAPDGYMKATRIEIAQDSLLYFIPHLLAHLTALHGLIPPRLLPVTDYAFLGQAWSISLEWQFYLIAPMLIDALHRRLTPQRMAIAIGAAIAMVLLSHVMPNGFLGGNLHNFLIGIGSFYLLKTRFDGARLLQFPVTPFWFAGVLFCIFLSNRAGLPYVIWLTAIAIVIHAHENSSSICTAISKFLTRPLVQSVGHMAYSIYLSHMLVILLSLYVLEVLGIRGAVSQSALLLVMAVTGTLALSMLTYRYIEKPFHEWGKRLKRPAVAANQALD